MWAAMGATSDAIAADIVDGVNTRGYNDYYKPFVGSNGSNVVGDYAWTTENSGGTTHPVGTKLPNELGLYDMAGNVLQWCWDGAGGDPSGALTNPTGSLNSSNRHFVGSCGWDDDHWSAYVKNSGSLFPYVAANKLGFRVLRRP